MTAEFYVVYYPSCLFIFRLFSKFQISLPLSVPDFKLVSELVTSRLSDALTRFKLVATLSSISIFSWIVLYGYDFCYAQSFSWLVRVSWQFSPFFQLESLYLFIHQAKEGKQKLFGRVCMTCLHGVLNIQEDHSKNLICQVHLGECSVGLCLTINLPQICQNFYLKFLEKLS